MSDSENFTSNDPFRVLGVPSGATPEEIREKYLELVRQYPPERDPSKFAAIRRAFDQLSDPVESLKKRLFDLQSTESIDAIIAETQANLRHRRFSTTALLELAKSN